MAAVGAEAFRGCGIMRGGKALDAVYRRPAGVSQERAVDENFGYGSNREPMMMMMRTS